MCESPGNPSRIAALSADQALTAIIGCPHMDFRRIVRIAMGVGRRTWSPPAKLGLAPRFAGLWVVRASIMAPRTKRSPRPCQPFPLKSPRTSTAPQPKREAPNPLRQSGARPRRLRSSPRSRGGQLYRGPSEPPRRCQRRLVNQGSSVSPSRSACLPLWFAANHVDDTGEIGAALAPGIEEGVELHCRGP
jgi:hypothetical protein